MSTGLCVLEGKPQMSTGGDQRLICIVGRRLLGPSVATLSVAGALEEGKLR